MVCFSKSGPATGFGALCLRRREARQWKSAANQGFTPSSPGAGRSFVFTSSYPTLRTQPLSLGVAPLGVAPLFWELKQAHNQVRDKNKNLGWAAFGSLISGQLGREASGKLTLSFSRLLVGKSKLSTRQEGTVLCQRRARNPPLADITLLTPGWSRSQNRNSSGPTSHS